MNRLSLAACAALFALLPAQTARSHDSEMFETPDGDGKIMSGIGNNPSEATAFESVTGFFLGMEKVYEVFDGLTSHPMNPTKLLQKLNDVGNQNQIPQLGLFFQGFDPNVPTMPMDAAIALGWHDAFIDKLAQVCKDYGKPMFILPGYEFNLTGYTPLEYPKAFRRIVDRFREHDVDNVAWVWNPFVGGAVNIFLDKTGSEWNWWPGKEYVNWIGANGFNPTVWATKNPINGSSLAMIGLLDHAEAMGVPVMVCETSGQLLTSYLPTADPGAQAQANTLWPNHFVPLFDMLNCEPKMKGFTYLSTDWTQTVQWPTWGDHRIQINAYLTAFFIQEVLKPQYANAGQFQYPYPWIPYKIFKTSLGGTLHFDIHNVPQGQPAALFLSASLLPTPAKVWPYHGDFWLAPPIVQVGVFTAGPDDKIRVSGVVPNNPAFSGLAIESQWISTAGIPKPMRIEIQ